MSDDDSGSRTARATGAALAGAFGLLARIRPADKALHPRGSLTHGTIRRAGLTGHRFDVPWLDEPGEDVVIVRASRAAGLPGPLPDVFGLAVRIPVPDGHADLLFSSTGSGPTTRFFLRPGLDPARGGYSTMFPYRTPGGGVVLGLRPGHPGGVGATGIGPTDGDAAGGLHFDLLVARPRGPWRAFGRLDVEPSVSSGAGAPADDPTDHPGSDSDIAFDAILNIVPGLEPYTWVREMRARSYRTVRHRRGDLRPVP